MNKICEEILGKMEKILDQLIANAGKLQESSRLQFLEEEILELQKKQEGLVESLQDEDENFQHSCRGDYKNYQSPILTRIGEKLYQFQKLNADFIENLRLSSGVIQFELQKKMKKTK